MFHLLHHMWHQVHPRSRCILHRYHLHQCLIHHQLQPLHIHQPELILHLLLIPHTHLIQELIQHPHTHLRQLLILPSHTLLIQLILPSHTLLTQLILLRHMAPIILLVLHTQEGILHLIEVQQLMPRKMQQSNVYLFGCYDHIMVLRINVIPVAPVVSFQIS